MAGAGDSAAELSSLSSVLSPAEQGSASGSSDLTSMPTSSTASSTAAAAADSSIQRFIEEEKGTKKRDNANILFWMSCVQTWSELQIAMYFEQENPERRAMLLSPEWYLRLGYPPIYDRKGWKKLREEVLKQLQERMYVLPKQPSVGRRFTDIPPSPFRAPPVFPNRRRTSFLPAPPSALSQTSSSSSSLADGATPVQESLTSSTSCSSLLSAGAPAEPALSTAGPSTDGTASAEMGRRSGGTRKIWRSGHSSTPRSDQGVGHVQLKVTDLTTITEEEIARGQVSINTTLSSEVDLDSWVSELPDGTSSNTDVTAQQQGSSDWLDSSQASTSSDSDSDTSVAAEAPSILHALLHCRDGLVDARLKPGLPGMDADLQTVIRQAAAVRDGETEEESVIHIACHDWEKEEIMEKLAGALLEDPPSTPEDDQGSPAPADQQEAIGDPAEDEDESDVASSRQTVTETTSMGMAASSIAPTAAENPDNSDPEPQQMFPCPHCEREFKSRHGVNGHLKVHKRRGRGRGRQ